MLDTFKKIINIFIRFFFESVGELIEVIQKDSADLNDV